MERCEECGFDPQGVLGPDAAEIVAAFARRYRVPLTRFLPGEDGPQLLRTRPAPDAWSALEYAAHVRDALRFVERRIVQVLDSDVAHVELDAADLAGQVSEGNYQQLAPVEVADELDLAAQSLAACLSGVTADDWQRWGTVLGEPRTVLDITRVGCHEGAHHLLDVGRALRAARDAAQAASS